MLKHIEFLTHFRELIPRAPLKNRTTGQCSRRINSAENKTYSGPKTPFSVSDEVPHVGNIDELLTLGPTLCPLCPYSAHRIWGRWGQCQSHENPICFYDLTAYWNFLGWELKTFGLLKQFAKTLCTYYSMYFLCFLVRTLQFQHLTGFLEYYSQCICVGDKGISRGRGAAGGIWVMNLRKMWELDHKLRHHLSSTPAGGCL